MGGVLLFFTWVAVQGGPTLTAERAHGSEACAFPEMAPGIYEGSGRPGDEYPRKGTLFLNFGGATMHAGAEDNAALDTSVIAREGHAYPAYTGGQDLALAAIQTVKQRLAAHGIRVVYEQRPRAMVPYTMVMMGGKPSDTTGPAGAGVAPLNCEDQNQRNIAYVFASTQLAVDQGHVILQEYAHSIGLQHTEGADRIMGIGYTTSPGDLRVFGDDCAPLFAQGQSTCARENLCHCGDATRQQDSAMFRALFAPADAPDDPPTIVIDAPADRSHMPEGQPVPVELSVGDDYGGYGWMIRVLRDGEVIQEHVDFERRGRFELQLDRGAYTLEAEIEDGAGQTDMHRIVIGVGDVELPEPEPEPDPNDEGGNADGGDPTGASSAGESGEGREDGGGTGDGAADGTATSGCTSAPHSRAGLWWLAALLAPTRRRCCRVFR